MASSSDSETTATCPTATLMLSYDPRKSSQLVTAQLTLNILTSAAKGDTKDGTQKPATIHQEVLRNDAKIQHFLASRAESRDKFTLYISAKELVASLQSPPQSRSERLHMLDCLTSKTRDILSTIDTPDASQLFANDEANTPKQLPKSFTLRGEPSNQLGGVIAGDIKRQDAPGQSAPPKS